SSQNPSQGRFSARGIDLTLGWQSGTRERPKRAGESDFDSATIAKRRDSDAEASAYRQTVTYQGVALFAGLSIAWPVWEMSWPAPAAVWQAARSGAIPKNASRTRLESAILLHMTFTLLSGFWRLPRKPARDRAHLALYLINGVSG